VAFDERDVCGKVWVSLGTVEDFSDVTSSQFGDWLVQVNAFHETGRFEDIPDPASFVCDLPEEEVPSSGGGCSHEGSTRVHPLSVLSGLLLIAVGWRRVRDRRAQSLPVGV